MRLYEHSYQVCSLRNNTMKLYIETGLKENKIAPCNLLYGVHNRCQHQFFYKEVLLNFKGITSS